MFKLILKLLPAVGLFFGLTTTLALFCGQQINTQTISLVLPATDQQPYTVQLMDINRRVKSHHRLDEIGIANVFLDEHNQHIAYGLQSIIVVTDDSSITHYNLLRYDLITGSYDVIFEQTTDQRIYMPEAIFDLYTTPDSRRVMFIDAVHQTAHVYDHGNGTTQQLPGQDGDPIHLDSYNNPPPAWNPSRTRFYYVQAESYTMASYDIDTHTWQEYPHLQIGDSSLRGWQWLNDNQQILLQSPSGDSLIRYLDAETLHPASDYVAEFAARFARIWDQCDLMVYQPMGLTGLVDSRIMDLNTGEDWLLFGDYTPYFDDAIIGLEILGDCTHMIIYEVSRDYGALKLKRMTIRGNEWSAIIDKAPITGQTRPRLLGAQRFIFITETDQQTNIVKEVDLATGTVSTITTLPDTYQIFSYWTMGDDAIIIQVGTANDHRMLLINAKSGTVDTLATINSFPNIRLYEG